MGMNWDRCPCSDGYTEFRDPQNLRTSLWDGIWGPRLLFFPQVRSGASGSLDALAVLQEALLLSIFVYIIAYLSLDRLIQGEGSERDAPMPLSKKIKSPLSVKICVPSADFKLPASRLHMHFRSFVQLRAAFVFNVLFFFFLLNPGFQVTSFWAAHVF